MGWDDIEIKKEDLKHQCECNQDTFKYGFHKKCLTGKQGNEEQFEVIASHEIDGVMYYALMPVADNENGDCVLLKLEMDENGEEILSTIDDDDEYERVADAFDDEVFSEIDYD